jgi:uncharacterized protein (DUF433 family)
MLVETRYEHIVLNETNTPLIAGTTIKVVELVLGQTAYGWSAEELIVQFPHLTLGQVHSALAYYWDHRDVLDADIEARLRKIDQIKSLIPVSPLVKRLKAEGLV